MPPNNSPKPMPIDAANPHSRLTVWAELPSFCRSASLAIMKNVFTILLLAVWPVIVTPLRAGTPPPGTWESVASSADGRQIVAASNARLGASGAVYISTNSGATWNSSITANYDWEAVASSADGNILLAAFGLPSASGLVYISSNAGANWAPANISPPEAKWNTVTSSADGTKLAAGAVNVLAVYTSTNSGTEWTRQTNGLAGVGIDYMACSADGNKLIAATGGTGGGLFTSTNSGVNWIQATNVPVATWYSVASSADGNQLLACSYFGGNVYISTNSGVNWALTKLPTNDWNSVASSADGTKLVALANSDSATLGVGSGGIWTSTNSGATWVSNKVQSAAWTCAAMSADGNELIASVGYPSTTGGIYVSQTTPSPVLKLAAVNGQSTLSWVIPSMNFILQQSSDLLVADWQDVTNVPVLNLMNLEDQVTFPQTNSSGFYRLTTP